MPRTHVSIDGDRFLLNGTPTYPGRTARGLQIEGRLLNARLVQGVFDDRNPETRGRWAYPDTGVWDAERNVREFLAAMPVWRRHGLLSFTLNLQGGSPEGYSRLQPWHNSAFEADGAFRDDYRVRAERILDFADELGMAPILGLFYFGQDERLRDEAAVLRAVDEVADWIVARGWTHLLLEVNNECNIRYEHPILQPERVHELILRLQERFRAAGRPLPVSTSLGGGSIPPPNILAAGDYTLLHGNGVNTPAALEKLIRDTRTALGGRHVPIVVNEDDHFGFDVPENNCIAALRNGASWGYFDFRMRDEGYHDGYQSVPVDWTISSARKRGFFDLVRELTGGV